MNWVNYDDVVDQVRGYGLMVDMLEVNTHKPVRCRVENEDREKRGWYWLQDTMLLDGNGGQASYIVGAFGVYRGNDSGKVKIALKRDGKQIKLDREQREAIAHRQRQQQKRMKAMRRAETENAAAKAAAVWRQYVPQGESDYLTRKGVEAFGLRFSPSGNGTLAVPMTDHAGRVWGLQIIRGKNRGERKREKEYWPKGMTKQGRYHLLGGTPRGLVLLAEGYATAASLHQASGLPVVVAFDANNLRPVAQVLAEAYRGINILICADDDYRTEGNPGVKAATEAALSVGGKWLAPRFAGDRPTEGRKGPTDYNDLHNIEGLHVVRVQVEACLDDLGWSAEKEVAARDTPAEGCGEYMPMPSRLTVDEAAVRFWGTYGMGGKVLFDEDERQIVHKDDVLNLLPRHGWEEMRAHPLWRVARADEIGFDPTGADERIRCNLYGGWPTEPKEGDCSNTLDLLQYLCNNDPNGRELYEWVLRWLAYPIQHPGAKMQSAIVVHGPQGTGKSLVFEAVCKIYEEYGRILGQESLEDKYNADWAEKKLFILADEVLARGDMFHIKNRLKGFITGDWIRVNPKFVAAHNERNHMNIVFLSNEHLPLVLENDDRRHCVIWTPPKLNAEVYDAVTEEMDNDGVAALHHYLLNLDLGDFKPWTKPPMTVAKQDLIHLGLSSEQRFVREWMRLELETDDGMTLPFCPCLGSDLYRVYERWCRSNGEIRPRPSNHFINFIAKQPGWTAGRSEATWTHFQDKSIKKRKMVVPCDKSMQEAAALAPSGSKQPELMRLPEQTKMEWLTTGHFAFVDALGVEYAQ